MRFLKYNPSNQSASIQILVLLTALLIGIIIGALCIAIIQTLFPQMDNTTFIRISLVIQSCFLFIFPSIVTARLFSSRPLHYLEIDKAPSSYLSFYTFGAIIVSLPLINLLVEWNEAMKLPESFSAIELWMQNREAEAKLITDNLLNTYSLAGVMSNLFVLGVCAAIGEELLFRGTIQQLLQNKLKNAHLAIWITAFIFSAIHLQFYGFIPRLLLGAFFGYIFVWSGNLWIPILGHFLNNAFTVLFSYSGHIHPPIKEMENIGTSENQWWVSVLCLLLFVGITWRMYVRRVKSK